VSIWQTDLLRVLRTLWHGLEGLQTWRGSQINLNGGFVRRASDLGTTVSGIQAAITFYTLLAATLMLTGRKIGAIIGRRRAFAIGCVI